MMCFFESETFIQTHVNLYDIVWTRWMHDCCQPMSVGVCIDLQLPKLLEFHVRNTKAFQHKYFKSTSQSLLHVTILKPAWAVAAPKTLTAVHSQKNSLKLQRRQPRQVRVAARHVLNRTLQRREVCRYEVVLRWSIHYRYVNRHDISLKS